MKLTTYKIVKSHKFKEFADLLKWLLASESGLTHPACPHTIMSGVHSFFKKKNQMSTLRKQAIKIYK